VTTPLRYKIADTEAEFEAIHRLNHRTFAEEIPQHPVNPQGRLVDKFHAENTYAICLDGGKLAGMVSGRAVRPFSLDGKLDGLDAFLPEGRKPVEVRLLAVEPTYRHSTVLARLVEEIAGHFAKLGCDLALISGTTRALQLYRRMGFVPFGPVVGDATAQYQPMYLTAETTTWWRINPAAAQRTPQNFLPGPVAIAPEVAAAMSAPAAYHRSESYLDSLASLHTRLAAFVNAPSAQLLMGSGTLANDVVAGQLKLLHRPGLIISEGEFGDRLVDHAERMGLTFTVANSIPGFVSRDIGWLWAVHCETSTGTLTDLPTLAKRCAASQVKLCVDCISSIGTVPIDLSNVYLASGSSGKALGAYPGLSMVFYRDSPLSGGLPRYLDLGMYVAAQGVAFTQSSNLVSALDVALSMTNWPDRFARLAHAGAWLHTRLNRLGFQIVAAPERAAPGICTIALPADVDSMATGNEMEAEGYLVATQSGYLRHNNWLQISLMGQWTWPVLRALPPALCRAVEKTARN
jgi:aspartate aminotransferase-like enzyme/GNAT superfamily N-acetyltransferase